MAFATSGASIQGFTYPRTRSGTANDQSAAFCGWVRPTLDGNYRRIFQHKGYSPASNVSFSLQLTQAANNKIYLARDDASATNEVVEYTATSNALIHVFCYGVRSAQPRMWINGAEYTSEGGKPPVNLSNGSLVQKFHVGMRADLASFAKCHYSEVAYWCEDNVTTMVAPTDDQVRAIMHGAFPGIYNYSNLRVVAPYQGVDQKSTYLSSDMSTPVPYGTRSAVAEHGLISRLQPIFVPSAAAGGVVTAIPPRLHNLDNQFSTNIASRLGGVLE